MNLVIPKELGDLVVKICQWALHILCWAYCSIHPTTHIVKGTNEHTHIPSEEEVNCRETKVGVKRRARESQDTSHHIVGESMQLISEGTATKLPKMDSLKRTIQRERARTLAAPVQPATLSQLALPNEYMMTAKGEPFLLYDSGAADAQRFLIFGTQANLHMLQSSRCWLADGTFKTAPSLFVQVYVVHGLRGGPDLAKDGHLLPSLFVLLACKTESIYRRMWEQIRILCPYAQPQSMLLDFEKAAINSFSVVWPLTVVKCCFFHLTQNVWRKIQAVGLHADYIGDKELAMRIRQIPALAFAHPFDVCELFGQVASLFPPSAEVAELLEYFQRTYVGRTLPSGYYSEPTFPINLWNYHLDTPFGIPKTTNAVEAWHRSFNSTVGCHHPTIWRFISALKREQGLVEVRHAKFLAGNAPTKRKRCQASEQALIDLVLCYFDENRSKTEFLRGVAHHFSLGTD